MVLVQHNINSWDSQYEEEALQTAMDLSRAGIDELRRQGIEPALLVWSETVLVQPYEGRYYETFPRYDPLIPFLKEIRVPLLCGAPIPAASGAWANGALFIQDGNEIFSYEKQRLIPFAEEIPFIEYEWMKTLMRKTVGFDSGWIPGEKTVIMKAGSPPDTLSFGVPICFEDAFAGLCGDFVKNGAELFINLTNDSWSKTVSAEIQHLAAARFRTIENRRVMVRSTNGGITAVIDAEGRIISSLPPFSSSVLALEVPIQQQSEPTVYQIFGDWFPLVSVLIVLGYLGLKPRYYASPTPRG
jgi:apolipoprotein N-acyltransferase